MCLGYEQNIIALKWTGLREKQNHLSWDKWTALLVNQSVGLQPLAVPVQWLCQKVFGLQFDSTGIDSWIWKGIHRETFKMPMKVFLIWNHIFGHCKQDECFWLYELSVPVHKDCILTYLNIVVVIIAIEICAIYFIFIASICIFEKKNGQRYYYLIVLYCFILLTEIELFLYREKIRALKVASYLLFIYVKDVSSCGIG